MKSAYQFACVALVLALGAGHQSAIAQSNLTTVKVAGTGRADQAKVELALARGYFADVGLNVEIVSGGATAQDYLSSIATNQVQVGAGSPNAAMMNALNRGIDIRIVADWARTGSGRDTTMSLIVRNDLIDSGAVKTVADLRGKVVSLGPGVGSVNEMFFDKLLATGNLKRADVNLTNVGFGEALAALGNKKLDAAVVIEPLVWMADLRRIAKPLITVGEVDPNAQVAVLFYSPEFARNTDLATRFMVAYLRGVRELQDALVDKKNTDAVVDILVKRLPAQERRVWIESPPSITDLNGRVNVAHIRAQAEFYKSTGSVTGPVPNLDKVVDMSFADAAIKQLGSRP